MVQAPGLRVPVLNTLETHWDISDLPKKSITHQILDEISYWSQPNTDQVDQLTVTPAN